MKETEIPDITPSYTVAFAYRHLIIGAEHICMLHMPEPKYTDAQAQDKIIHAIAKMCFKFSDNIPFDILTVDKASLPKLSFGKISRVLTLKSWDRKAFFNFRASASV